jgi:hypothetical protein
MIGDTNRPQVSVFPPDIGEPLLLRARRYRDLAREARLAALQSNEGVRDPFIRVATQWELRAHELELGQDVTANFPP